MWLTKRAMLWLVLLAAAAFALGFGLRRVTSTPASVPASPTATVRAISTDQPTSTLAPTSTPAVEPSPLPSATASPTVSATPLASAPIEADGSTTPAPSPTPDYPVGIASLQTFCRYGPASAYLPVWVLYPGVAVRAEAQDASGQWLLVRATGFADRCWAPQASLALNPGLTLLPLGDIQLPRSDLYRAPAGLALERDGAQVNLTWEPVFRAADDDRGYLFEAWLCHDGALVFEAIQSDLPQVTFLDEAGCVEPSRAHLYTAEIHGYSQPVTVPLPVAEES
jgi:hypothetical protein